MCVSEGGDAVRRACEMPDFVCAFGHVCVRCDFLGSLLDVFCNLQLF